MFIDNTMGAVLIGTLMSGILLGVTYIQSFYYFIDCRTDAWYLKSLVVSTVVLDTVHMLLISHSIYHWLVTNFNNPSGLEQLVWSAAVEALPTALTSMLVQGFFVLRVWHLSRSYLLSGLIVLIVVVGFGCVLAWVILAMQMEALVDLLAITPLTIAINAVSASADVIIAASLVILLSRARTGFKRSDTIINKLILFVVNTGVLTSCIAIAAFISVLASPNTLIYAPFYFCIGRLYVNSFLATLNGRKHIAGGVGDVSHMLVSMPQSVTSPSHSSGKVRPKISILVEAKRQRDGLQSDGQDDGKNSDLESQKNLSL
ncbi:hypothetical protein L208DRAFT_757835 [Tricholoma matsutake]|nr:hypothetical protein L208DRAFT_757835 [Tricholoma matsutake 945]